ncbi:glycerol-3-phosphate 1-O-acyltransferase [Synchytrium microbalum]|uniref:Glycerol-3-phosphate 1-O-acyltransferase n=1 Tax=Synchytrium microbalum TaxID=1806994 RepID=A0A507C9J1_9FUNG|nr:glycerol-3-phosphate 1-O-acyltransferase [Synchytrium microbalum]TPX34175.1 glycerol-3-phosphate 1-O-acyltransferase [Synchytrium microbalum]
MEHSKSGEDFDVTNTEDLGRFRKNPLSFMVKLTASSARFYEGTDWRSYDKYIGSKIFYPQYTQNIKTELLAAPTIRAMSDSMARKNFLAQSEEARKKKGKRLEDLQAAQWKYVNKIVDNMTAQMESKSLIRFMAFIMNNLVVRLYNQGVHIRQDEFVALREAALKAQKENVSLIFLPCHRSHIDYLTISYILFRLGIGLPAIAAGDNLNIPIIGKLLQQCGAFYIRRTWGDDVLYTTIMREYMDTLLRQGHNIEFFIEGTRSRTGKMLQPKLGMLKLIFEPILLGRVKDAIIVPMSIGYDKVIESESYVNELLGTPKEKESLFQVMNSASVLGLQFGRIDIRFAKPYSLKEYIQTQVERRGPSFDPITIPQNRNTLLQALGYQVLSDINSVGVIMPTALVGTVLLTLRGRGVGRDDLIRRVNWLIAEIEKRGGNVADFDGKSTGQIVDRTIPQLKDLIGQRTDLIEPVFFAVRRFELSLYRNQVIHLFIGECILAAALYSSVKSDRAARVVIRPQLYEDSVFLSSLLKNEFVYGPQGFESNFDETVRELSDANVTSVVEVPPAHGSETMEMQKALMLSEEERRIGRENFDFYCFLIWPFIETYWLAAISLFSLMPESPVQPSPSGNDLAPDAWVPETVFMNRVMFFGRTIYYEGDMSYFESVNKETLKNAFTRLTQMGLILTYTGISPPNSDNAASFKPNAKTVWWALAPEWCATGLPAPPPLPVRVAGKAQSKTDDNGINSDEAISFKQWRAFRPDGKLWDMCERIGSFRREGKNRRDTATVSNRVIRLARITHMWTEVKGDSVSMKAKLEELQPHMLRIPLGEIEGVKRSARLRGKL